MHLLVADKLTCAHCGPAYPLILLAHDVKERQVLEGSLGCPNCRERYPVERGFADLRPEPRSSDQPEYIFDRPAEEEVVEVAAMLGETEEGARPLLLGSAARFAPDLAERLPGLDWLAASPVAMAWGERPGLDRMRVGATLPFQDRSIRGVVVEGESAARWGIEAVRVLALGSRLLVLDSPAGLRELLLSRGLKVAEPREGVVLATR